MSIYRPCTKITQHEALFPIVPWEESFYICTFTPEGYRYMKIRNVVFQYNVCSQANSD